MNQTHYRIALVAEGVSPAFLGISLPVSGEAAFIEVKPYAYRVDQASNLRTLPSRVWGGASLGGAAGYSIVQTDWMLIPPNHRPLFEELDGVSVRIRFYDIVLARMQSDIELWIYGHDGTPTMIPQRRVHCTGIVVGAFDIDCTLHGNPLPIPRLGRGADHATRRGAVPTARELLLRRR